MSWVSDIKFHARQKEVKKETKETTSSIGLLRYCGQCFFFHELFLEHFRLSRFIQGQ